MKRGDTVKANVKDNAFLKKTGRLFNKYIHSKVAVMLTLSVIISVISGYFTGVVFGYDFVYNGEYVCQLPSKSRYEEALNIADEMIEGGSVRDYVSSHKYIATVTVGKRFASAEELAYIIVDSTENIVKGSAVKVNGNTLVCADGETALRCICADYLAGFDLSEECVSYFNGNVEITDGYFIKDYTNTKEEILDALTQLDVVTLEVKREEYSIPFNTVTRKSDARVLGEVITAVEGENGIGNTVEQRKYFNGEFVSSEISEDRVIKEPIDKIIVVGTAKPKTDVSPEVVSALGFIRPVKWKKITSYWGDGRNHKGVDLAADKGTPIYASRSGRVIVSQKLNTGYGYHVIIDHEDGYSTVYAHASQLLVSYGEYVKQGQVIALVGTTGQSSGNHLHFEIRYKNQKIDPAPFIGIY